jgi:hypothetical protein
MDGLFEQSLGAAGHRLSLFSVGRSIATPRNAEVLISYQLGGQQEHWMPNV